MGNLEATTEEIEFRGKKIRVAKQDVALYKKLNEKKVKEPKKDK